MAPELSREWDVVVVGAGVAGAMSALHVARANLRVLLVEKCAWPRDKACGGCLNAVALRMLAHAGIELHEGSACTRMRLACRGRTATLPLRCGLAISRRRLDATLVACAEAAGARFLPATRASLGECTRAARAVVLKSGCTRCTVTAHVVLDCSGLATHLMPEIDWHVAPRSRIGVAASGPAGPPWLAQGVIQMACSMHGYVGLVRAEGGSTNVAAALDPVHCREIGGPARAVAEILESAGCPVGDDLHRATWCGTPHLTRTRSHVGAERVLILGDAAGYVEPFTGEGMAWALADAAAVQPFAREAAARWTDDLARRWGRCHGKMQRARQSVCRDVSRWLRRPHVLAAALPLLDIAPAMVAPLMARLNREFKAGYGVAR